MSRINWDEMLAGLEQQRTGLEQELADVDAVIDTVRQRAAPRVMIADLQRPRANGAKAKRAAKPAARGRGVDPDVLARIRKQYEAGVPIKQIPEGRGHSGNWIYQLASDGKWKRPNTGAATPAAAAPTPKGEQLSGSVRCTNPECGQWTSTDPCGTCGKKLNRKGW